MKISIDTKEDSHNDIKKIIKMLQHLVGEDYKTNAPVNIFDDTPSESSGASALANMFGDDNTEEKKKEESPTNYLDILSAPRDEDKDDKPQPATIIEY